MENTATVRLARMPDLDGILVLLAQLNQRDLESDRDQCAAIYSNILRSNDFHFVVAQSGIDIVGVCYLNVIPNLTRSCHPYALIENVVVDAQVRKRGIGKQLIKFAIDYSFQSGCYKVMLMTGRDVQLHRFYEQCGMTNGNKVAFIVRDDRHAQEL